MPGIRTVASEDFAIGFGMHAFHKETNKMTTGARIRQAAKEAATEQAYVETPELATRTNHQPACMKCFDDVSSAAPPATKKRHDVSRDPKKNDDIKVKYDVKSINTAISAIDRHGGAKGKGTASPVVNLARSMKKLEGMSDAQHNRAYAMIRLRSASKKTSELYII
jgi:hypothetical protein